jgi:hypothetical protein
MEHRQDSQTFNASTSTEITLDYCFNESDESSLSSWDDSWSSEEEEDSRKFDDYRQMLTAGNRLNKKTRNTKDTSKSTNSKRVKVRRNKCTDTSSSLETEETLRSITQNTRQNGRKCDETITTQQTTSVASLGVDEFQWLASGGERAINQNRRADNSVPSSKNTKPKEGIGRFFRRGGRKSITIRVK